MTAIAYLAMATAASAATTDLKEQRIPNRLVFPVMFLALLWHGLQDGFEGLAFFALGWLAGVLVFIFPFIIGAMGAGDVKLMAALGALMGWRFILVTAVYASIAGLFIALYIIIRKKNWLTKPISYLPHNLSVLLAKILLMKAQDNRAETNLDNASVNTKKEKTMIPYGLSIAIGVFIVLTGRNIAALPLMNLL